LERPEIKNRKKKKAYFSPGDKGERIRKKKVKKSKKHPLFEDLVD
jgi:hypothetical protein